MGFFLMLIVAGGLGSLVAIADPPRARLLPFTLATLFSGIAFYTSLFGLGWITEIRTGPSELWSILFCIGLLTLTIAGAIYGFIIGTRRNRRIGY